MTNDLTAIRARMEALMGFTAGPWYTHNQPGDWGLGGAHSIHVADANPYEWDQCIAHVEYQTPYCLGEKPSVIAAANTAACNALLIAAAPDMRDTILALCDETERLRGLVRSAVAIIHRADNTEGTCCCGESMVDHAEGMSCGHIPVDVGSYYACCWQEDAQAALAATETRHD